jgi:hypothetical protein
MPDLSPLSRVKRRLDFGALGVDRKWLAEGQTRAIEPQPTSLRCAAKWENEFYAVGIAPKDHGSPGENLMLFFGRSRPANN